MRYTLPLVLLASPALAHDGIHAHPHGLEAWIVGLGLLVIAAVGVVALKVRK
ncbi:hypothetical protein [uncultured Roseovarius sp.]|uniref:hypothetical protein n=1 Tax=uncultured Roseovarius sp. TaxID=293344 RepID=UPI0025ECA3E4|nr:hypothetical protein [uncultured Roseovarius sp.]